MKCKRCQSFSKVLRKTWSLVQTWRDWQLHVWGTIFDLECKSSHASASNIWKPIYIHLVFIPTTKKYPCCFEMIEAHTCNNVTGNITLADRMTVCQDSFECYNIFVVSSQNRSDRIRVRQEMHHKKANNLRWTDDCRGHFIDSDRREAEEAEEGYNGI